MIERMYKLTVLSRDTDKRDLVRGLRAFGLVHVNTSRPQSNMAFDELLQRSDSLYRVKSALSERFDRKKDKKEALADSDFEGLHKRLCSELDELKELESQAIELRREIDARSKWGDFDPRELKELGYKVALVDKKGLGDIQEPFIRLSEVDKMISVAFLADMPQGLSPVSFSDQRLSDMNSSLSEVERKIAGIESDLKASSVYIDAYERQMRLCLQAQRLEEVQSAAVSTDGLCLLTGFLPQENAKDADVFIRAHRWGYLMEEPGEDDLVPTKVRYTKVTRIIKPVFDFLGTVPGYGEYDISLWFLLFFSLFFAMIYGDAAYGLIVVGLGAYMNIKAKKLTDINKLVYTLGLATTLWGAITGTWFGLESAVGPSSPLRYLVIPSLANYPDQFGVDPNYAQNSLMKLCFTIGMVHLCLACLLSIIRKARDRNLSLFADLGWLGSILALYFLVLSLVIGQSINANAVVYTVITGFMLVIVFGNQEPGQSFGKGLAKGAGGFFSSFINTISAFGNIMSYIRLFAVGLASLAIAQSFNGMMESMPLALGVVIAVLGHGLNLVMGLLSVIVHGVRLNVLEFSGQLGMEWTGINYDPFRVTEEINKSRS